MIKVQGISSKGGVAVTSGQSSTNKLIQSFPLSTVTVYLTGTLTLAPLFSDSNGAVVKANPFTAASDGAFDFYVAAGRYDLRFSGTGITTPFTLSDVTVGDSGQTDASAYASLAAAVTAIGAVPTNLVISSTLFPSGGSTTIPSTLTLEFKGAGSLLLGTGHTVIIQSDADQWPVQQLFFNALAGQGTVSFVGNQTGVRLNVKWWGAVGDDSTDNTAIFNAVVAAAHTLQVAVIDVPTGVYRFTAAATGSVGYKAQINMPVVSPAGEWDQITFEGTVQPMVVAGTVVNPNLATTKATVLKTTLTSDALMGGTNAGSFTAVKLTLRNIVLRCPDDPQVIGLDTSYLLGYELDHVIIDTGRYTTSCVQPTHTTGIGLRGPVFAAGGDQYIRKLAISGFFTGMTNTEQLCAEHIIISGCAVGMEMQFAVHPSRFNYVDMYNNTTHIKVTGQNVFSIGLLNLELATLACMPTLPPWQVTTTFLDDATNVGRGTIVYQNATACFSVNDDTFIRNGAKYFNLRQASKNIPLSFVVHRTAALSVLNTTPTTVTWTAVESQAEAGVVTVPFTTYTFAQSGLYKIDVELEFEPSTVGAFFQLNLLIGANKIDNDVRTSIGTSWNVVLRCSRLYLAEQAEVLSVTVFHDFGSSRNIIATSQYTPKLSIVKLQN